MRRVRALVLVLLLTGNLFPPIGLSVALLAAVFAAPLVVWEIVRALPKLHAALAVLPLFGLLSAAHFHYGAWYSYGETKWHNLVTITLLSALSASLLRDRDGIRTFARTWVVVGLALAAGALAGARVNGRAGGLDEANPIWLARMLATAVVAVVWLYWTRTLATRWALPAGVLLVAGLLATGSRGPLAAMAVGVLAVASTLRRYRGVRLAVLGFAVAGAALAAVGGLLGSGRVADFLAGSAGQGDNSRATYWSQTLDLIRHHPWGVGIGNWGYYTGNAPRASWPHDLTLEVFAEHGWIVGAAFVSVVVMVLARLARRTDRDPVVALVFGLLVCEAVSVSVSGDLNARTFFTLLTLGWIVERQPSPKPTHSMRPVMQQRGKEPPVRSRVAEPMSPAWERAFGLRPSVAGEEGFEAGR